MLSLKINIDSIKNRIKILKQLDERMPSIIIETAEEAKRLILNRVDYGMEVTGSFRDTDTTGKKIGRYSEDWAKHRIKKGLTIGRNNLNFSGGLHKNFVVVKPINPKRNIVVSLRFTNAIAKRHNSKGAYSSNGAATYAELARYHEKKGRISFRLSPTQAKKVISFYRSKIRL